ncbi:MAG: hypothetical protein FWB86_01560 [Treponema sp.]|nr:hypothetical protein [Treponema sp.]MCL2250830.1 hypothetical protein [Treponema sp.]
MKTELFFEPTFVEPKQLVGTKWVGWSDLATNQMSVEFVDMTNCIYTSQPKRFPLKYNITEGKIFINCIKGSFELRGNVLYNNELPVFEKAA